LKKLFFIYYLTFSFVISAYSLSKDYKVVYRGEVNKKSFIAVSVFKDYSKNELNEIVKGLLKNDRVLVIYKNYKYFNTSQPLAVYNGKVIELFNSNIKTSRSYPTIQNKIDSSSFRYRVGAICRDGTRSSATGRGACSHHGGVSRWLYEASRNKNATIAYICKDYYLVCALSICKEHGGVLAEIKNRDY